MYRWGNDGFIQFAGEVRDRGYTYRSLSDPRTQYFAGDIRNSDPRFTNQSFLAKFGTHLV